MKTLIGLNNSFSGATIHVFEFASPTNTYQLYIRCFTLQKCISLQIIANGEGYQWIAFYFIKKVFPLTFFIHNIFLSCVSVIQQLSSQNKAIFNLFLQMFIEEIAATEVGIHLYYRQNELKYPFSHLIVLNCSLRAIKTILLELRESTESCF